MADSFDQDTELNVAELGAGGGGGDLAKAQAELEAMKQRLSSMEQEAATLKEFQEKAQQNAGLAASDSSQDTEAKQQADARSVYVGNVDYAVAPEELQMHFQGCGTVNRVTILTDRMGNPKVSPKRTNVPGFRQPPPFARGRGRGGFGGRGYGRGPPRGGYYGGGFGYAPRGRRGRYYSPY